MSSKARDVAVTVALPIVLGLAPWALDKRGIGVPIWMVTAGGVLVILGGCYGLFFPVSWIIGKVLRRWGATTISTSNSVSIALMFALVATLVSFWVGHNKTYNYRTWQSDVNETVTRKSYFDETVVLDGKTFDHCKFTNVNLCTMD